MIKLKDILKEIVNDKTIIAFLKILEKDGIVAKNAYKNNEIVNTIKSIVSMSKQEFDDFIKKNPNKNAKLIYSEFNDWKQSYNNKIEEKLNHHDESYQYSSDDIRHDYIEKALKQKPSQQQPDYDKLIDSYDDYFSSPYEDLTFVRNRGDYIEYYEGFVESCWEALYEKPEYKGLSEEAAIDKLVKERFTKIAKNLNLKIAHYEFRDDVLIIQFDKLGK